MLHECGCWSHTCCLRAGHWQRLVCLYCNEHPECLRGVVWGSIGLNETAASGSQAHHLGMKSHCFKYNSFINEMGFRKHMHTEHTNHHPEWGCQIASWVLKAGDHLVRGQRETSVLRNVSDIIIHSLVSLWLRFYKLWYASMCHCHCSWNLPRKISEALWVGFCPFLTL